MPNNTRWLHVLCTPLLTALSIATGRGHLDEKLEGIVIHDEYATCFTLEGCVTARATPITCASSKP